MKPLMIYISILSALLLFSGQTLSSENTDLHVHDPWIREAPPNAKVLAAYMMLENHSNKNIAITKISSPDFRKIEIHVSKMKDGSMTMQQRKRIVVHAKKHFILQPGDYHLMLFNPKKQMKHGDIIPFTFTLDNGQTINKDIKVKRVLGSVGKTHKSAKKSDMHSDKHSDEHNDAHNDAHNHSN